AKELRCARRCRACRIPVRGTSGALGTAARSDIGVGASRFSGNGWRRRALAESVQRGTDGRPDASLLTAEPEEPAACGAQNLDLDSIGRHLQRVQGFRDRFVDVFAFDFDRSHRQPVGVGGVLRIIQYCWPTLKTLLTSQ